MTSFAAGALAATVVWLVLFMLYVRVAFPPDAGWPRNPFAIRRAARRGPDSEVEIIDDLGEHYWVRERRVGKADRRREVA